MCFGMRSNILAGLADEGIVFEPAGIDNRSGAADFAAEEFGQFKELLELLLATHTTAAADDHTGIFDALAALGASLLGDQAYARLWYVLGGRYPDDLPPAFAIVGDLLKGTRPDGRHLWAAVGGYDFSQQVPAERWCDLKE